MPNGKKQTGIAAAVGPALGGGLASASSALTKKFMISDTTEAVQAENTRKWAPLSGGLIALLMLGMDEPMIEEPTLYGMIGGSIALAANEQIEEFIGEDVLADDLDEWFNEMDEEDEDEEDEDEDYED